MVQIMIEIAAFLLLQPSAPTGLQPGAPPTAETQPAEKAEPRIVCTMEPVTGARARKMRVCKTQGYDKRGERDRESFGKTMNNGVNVQPVLPPGVGG
jgi:hypothetical protein